MRGRFITFEGLDGAGKSTHLEWFAGRLRARGIDVRTTREPGGTRLGERLRELLLGEPMDLETETLLMFAARTAHLTQLIRPTLAAGRWVVCDRFTDATFAYQGGGRGVDPARIEQLERWVHQDLQPDLTVVLDVPESVALARLSATGRAPDRFEQESTLFFRRVRAVYRERAARFPERIRLVDANRDLSEIQKELEELSLIS
jgi:dTMP kinase